MIPLAFISPLASAIVVVAIILSQYGYSFVLAHKLAGQSPEEMK